MSYQAWAMNIVSAIAESQHMPYWYKRRQLIEIERHNEYYQELYNAGKDADQVLCLVTENYIDEYGDTENT